MSWAVWTWRVSEGEILRSFSSWQLNLFSYLAGCPFQFHKASPSRWNTVVPRDRANTDFAFKNSHGPTYERKVEIVILPLLLWQHRRRVRAYGGRRGHVQGVPHPAQEPEDPGCRCGDHPPESRHQARDLVGSDHQLIDRGPWVGSDGEKGLAMELERRVRSEEEGLELGRSSVKVRLRN